MLFTTPIFLFYFLPVVLLLYFVCPQKAKNGFLLVASLLFYTWGAPKFVFVLVVSIIADWLIARRMAGSEGRQRKQWLWISLLLNIALLAFFKYANFFVENVQAVQRFFGVEPVEWVAVALPVGISFITFQKISYTVDVYRKTVDVQHNLMTYSLYILMFPQLVAGPIVRYNEISVQLEATKRFVPEQVVMGFCRFVVGLAKKVLIANVLAEQVDAIFAVSPACFSTTTAWVGMLAYTLQIYFDFAGYSDMALGIGQMLGYRFPENFNFPYISRNITEFWRRWHITLGAWMKSYLYIPLGGNRCSTQRMLFNLFVVIVISGIWHGAAWTFVAWGIFHGLFLMADKLFLLKWSEKMGSIPSVLLTFLIVMLGWVLFRADSIAYAFDFYETLFSFDFYIDAFYFDTRYGCILFVAVLGAMMGFSGRIEESVSHLFDVQKGKRRVFLLVCFSLVLYVLCGGMLLTDAFNPFIYFRF